MAPNRNKFCNVHRHKQHEEWDDMRQSKVETPNIETGNCERKLSRVERDPSVHSLSVFFLHWWRSSRGGSCNVLIGCCSNKNFRAQETTNQRHMSDVRCQLRYQYEIIKVKFPTYFMQRKELQVVWFSAVWHTDKSNKVTGSFCSALNAVLTIKPRSCFSL